MNKLPYLLSRHLGNTPPVIEPDPNEPYHVIFNFLVVSNSLPQYVFISGEEGFAEKVSSLDVLVDHPPQPDPAYMHFRSPASYAPSGARMSFFEETDCLLKVKDINKVAHPDRRNRLPKGFEFRFSYLGTSEFPNTYLIKYCLNTERTKYLTLRAYTDTVTGNVQLVLGYSFDSVTVESNPVDVGSSLQGTESPSINFIIRDGSLELYVGQPGDLKDSLELPSVLNISTDVDMEMFVPIDGYPTGIDEYVLSLLLIYDAYL